MALHTILGAGGAIANSLLDVLTTHNEPVRLVGRHVQPTPRAQTVRTDATQFDQLKTALDGSTVVYLLVGLPYSTEVWQQQWPAIMTNTIEVCKRIGARLLYFDNVYMYGLVNGPQTEETPFNPISKKGEVRTQIVTHLLDEMRSGDLTALVARSADFYGPYSTLMTSLVNLLLLDKLANDEPAQWFGNAQLPHSFAYTTDMAQALYLLQRDEQAFAQTWYLPTAPNPPTWEDMVRLAAPRFGAQPNVFVINRDMLASLMVDNPLLAEVYEMLYQYEEPYIVDSTKFNRAYEFIPTPYAEGILLAAEAFKRSQSVTS